MMQAYIRIAEDHPAFAGHFPGSPILPGAVLLGEILHSITSATGISFDRCSIPSAKFKRIVRPGDSLVLQFEFTGPAAIRFELRAADDLIADGMLQLSAPS